MKILHLYPDLLNLYGEYGNVECLKRHLIDQGFKVDVKKASLHSKPKFEDYDFIYCGSGLESNLKVALKDLLKNKASFLKAVKKGKYILFTGNAMELLGEKLDGEEALNIAPIVTNFSSKRLTGDVVLKNKEFGEVVGFINKCSIIFESKKDGLFDYVFKDPNLNDNSETEGYRINNLIGTHIIGPVLVKNPSLMKFFVEGLAKTKKKNFVYKDIAYPYEEDSYNVTLNALKERIKE